MTRRWVAVALLAVVLITCAHAFAQSKTRKRAAKKPAPAAPAAPVRTKIAEGRYQLLAREGPSTNSWEEPWTLYKTKTGYEIEEQWKASREGNANTVIVDVSMVFSSGLYPIHVRIGSDLSANRLDCSMTMTEFRCTDGAKQTAMAVSGPYNFFLPSPWLLSSIARRAPKKPDQPVPVKLVQMTGMGPDGPMVVEHQSQVAYVGEDQVEVQGTRYLASIYEIRAPNAPVIMAWLSPEGVVLMMQDAAKPEQRMELVEFKRLGPF